MRNSEATAVIDAAIVYGASRWLREIHKNPSSEWDHTYKRRDDELLFLEFLHDLVLYDKIVMDSSSVSRAIPNELLEVFAKVNASANLELLSRSDLAPYHADEIDSIAAATCRLISGATEDEPKRRAVLNTRIPWAYKSSAHHDFEMMTSVVKELDMELEFVPFALFAYRGLCYSGFANYQASKNDAPVAYVASPGRIAALKHLVSAPELRKLEFARRAYRDLVELLRIPASGYNFSHLQSLDPSQVSQLALAVSGKSPREALQTALRLRKSAEAQQLRVRWADRIWGTAKSAALGINHPGDQSMENISAGGDVIQIYYASPDNT